MSIRKRGDLMENLTRKFNLVQEIKHVGFFSNPAGVENFDMIVLEKVGSGGTRVYKQLRPGETLNIAERMLGSFIAVKIDMKQGRQFPVEGEYMTREKIKTIFVSGNVRYHVTDSALVASSTDPLREVQDKIQAELTASLMELTESEVNVRKISYLVRDMDEFQHLGIQIESYDILDFQWDKATIAAIQTRIKNEAKLDEVNATRLLEKKHALEDAELENELQRMREKSELDRKQMRHAAIDFSNFNVLMHENPEKASEMLDDFREIQKRNYSQQEQLVDKVIDSYLESKREEEGEINPAEIKKLLDTIVGDNQYQPPLPGANPRIVFGKSLDSGNAAEEEAESDSDNDQKE